MKRSRLSDVFQSSILDHVGCSAAALTFTRLAAAPLDRPYPCKTCQQHRPLCRSCSCSRFLSRDGFFPLPFYLPALVSSSFAQRGSRSMRFACRSAAPSEPVTLCYEKKKVTSSDTLTLVENSHGCKAVRLSALEQDNHPLFGSAPGKCAACDAPRINTPAMRSTVRVECNRPVRFNPV